MDESFDIDDVGRADADEAAIGQLASIGQDWDSRPMCLSRTRDPQLSPRDCMQR